MEMGTEGRHASLSPLILGPEMVGSLRSEFCAEFRINSWSLPIRMFLRYYNALLCAIRSMHFSLLLALEP